MMLTANNTKLTLLYSFSSGYCSIKSYTETGKHTLVYQHTAKYK